MNSREEWVVHVAIHRLQGGRIINSPMPPLLFHHLHPHPDGPSASWVWKSGKPIHLLYWCFLQIVPSTSFQKRGDIGDTKSYYLVVNLRRKQPTIGLFSLSGQSVHIRISSETSWPEYIDAFWIGLMGCNTLPSIRSILHWKCELFSRIFDRCLSI